MKLKNFFNSRKRNDFFQELKNDFKPILEKVSAPVTTYAKKHPRKTFFLMIAIVIANMMFLFLFTDSFKSRKGFEITDLELERFKYAPNNSSIPEITVSFENIRKVKMIRDSLAYLMSLKNMTYQDTLTFVRLMDEFQKISSGTSGIPPVTLESLRKAGRFNHIKTDTANKPALPEGK